jgi:hypothetical protein
MVATREGSYAGAMKALHRSSVAVSLPLGLGALLATILAATAIYAVTPASERPRTTLELAYARLQATSHYRIRETILRPQDGIGGVGVITTDFAAARRRQVVDVDAPGLGVVRIESVRDGDRAAVRADVPALCSLAVGAPGLPSAETRQLFRQLIAVALSAQVETPASAGLLALGREGAAVRTPAEMRAAMDETRAWLGAWHRNDGLEMRSPDTAGFTPDARFVGVGQHPRYGRVLHYRQQPIPGQGRDQRAARMIFVSEDSGLPVAEEVVDAGGRVMSRVEYLDVGAPVAIDVPACL